MTQVIVGLGNPGEEYRETRHNAGRLALENFRAKHDLNDWIKDKKREALVTKGKIGKKEVLLVCPEMMMNRSGQSVGEKNLIVIHDDLDLPLGKMKIVVNRGAGGHRGVESIVRKIKTEDFVRVKIGICSTTPTGKLKKPKGEPAVVKFILGKFSPAEKTKLKKILTNATAALEVILTQGAQAAMNEFN